MPPRHPVVRVLFLLGGWTALVLGLIGVVLPLMPTTPFMILAAFLFASGSPRMHAWLIGHPRFGPPIRRFQEDRAITRRNKTVAIVVLWASILTTAFLFVPLWWVQVMLVLVAVGVTTYLLSLGTAPPEDETDGSEPREPAEKRPRRASL